MRPHDPSHPFLTRDAASLGVTRPRLALLRRTGVLVSPVRGVLMRADQVDDVVARAAAVAMVLPPGAAVCRSLAAWMHGTDTRTPAQRHAPLPLECVVPRGKEPPSLPGVVSHVDMVPPDDITCAGGIPVTSLERTALDVARFSPPHMALATLDAFAAEKAVDVERLAERIEQWGGLRGVAQARRLIAWTDGGSESPGESWLRLRSLDAGFPAPETQIWITDVDGVPLYRLDLGWPDLRIAVEYDGLEFHDAPEQRRRDIARREDLARRFGWNVIGVGRGEVLGSSLELERGIGELLGMAPQILRRTW